MKRCDAFTAALSWGVVLFWSGGALANASFMGLGDLPGGISQSTAGGVSSDGGVAVGASYPAGYDEPFRWTSGGGMVGLGQHPGGCCGLNAYDVSSDGSVVGGGGSGPGAPSFSRLSDF